MWKIVKKRWLPVLFAISVVMLSLAIGYRVTAKDKGISIGKFWGDKIGSVNGLLDGKSTGEEDGKAAGLSAEDTTVDIKGFFEGAGDMGVLQVLSASVDMSNVHSIGDDYAALYHMTGKAVFTVDLNNAEIIDQEDSVLISIPVPEVNIEIDETKTEKLAEYQKGYFKGKTTDGYEAYVNSAKEIINNSEESIANYDTLMDMAKKSALSTVKELAENVSIEKRKVIVNFKEVGNIQ